MKVVYHILGILLAAVGGWVSGNAGSDTVLLAGVLAIYFAGILMGWSAPERVRRLLRVGGVRGE